MTNNNVVTSFMNLTSLRMFIENSDVKEKKLSQFLARFSHSSELKSITLH